MVKSVAFNGFYMFLQQDYPCPPKVIFTALLGVASKISLKR
jgi:hypothetical protein